MIEWTWTKLYNGVTHLKLKNYQITAEQIGKELCRVYMLCLNNENKTPVKELVTISIETAKSMGEFWAENLGLE